MLTLSVLLSRIAAAAAITLAALYATLALAQAPAEEALRQIIAAGGAAHLDWAAAPLDRQTIDDLYAANGHRLLWSDAVSPSKAAITLLQEMRGAAERGLDPEDYPGNRLAYRLHDLIDSPHAGLAQWALFDVSLSLAGIRFASDLHYGRIEPAAVGHNLTVERIRLDIPVALARLAAADNPRVALDQLEPQFSHYALLKRQLARYRALAGQTRLNDLPPLPAKFLKPGDAYAGVAQLQRLLTAVGDFGGAEPSAEPTLDASTASSAPPATDAPQTLTPPLTDALEHFQRRHGEKPDGVLGASTLAKLTKPLRFRARQIELTMERFRWLPSALGSAPIIVNIPQFRLFAFESTVDAEAHIRQMDVIVGKAFEATQTPVFTADMSYLIFRPYWDVPYSIARLEIVPAARRDPAYLDKHQMEIVGSDGDEAIMPNTPQNLQLVARGALRVRQKPGPNNSLGLIKFMLPNRYNVYLHSTPAKALFAESRRDFSHGCVRVGDPVGLAEYVLRDSPEWTREKIIEAMNAENSLTVTLKNHIRVFIVYGTALAMENGDVLFFDDIYGHDQRLEAALNSRRLRTQPSPAAVLPATGQRS